MQVAGSVDRTSTEVCPKLNISCKTICIIEKTDITIQSISELIIYHT
jgi:hypothetical protein